MVYDKNVQSHLISLAVSELRNLSEAPEMFAISGGNKSKLETEAPFKQIIRKGCSQAKI